jgi:3-hydroxyacyl-[acyl-carrier-protein] dehydratase
LSVTAEVLSHGPRETKLKAHGSVEGRTTVSARLVLERYNLADQDPADAWVDEEIRQQMRNLLTLLYQPGPPVVPATA